MPGERDGGRDVNVGATDGVRQKGHGIIAAGKLADRVLIDGARAKKIPDTRNITTVIKAGKIDDPAAIEKAMGITPRPTRQ